MFHCSWKRRPVVQCDTIDCPNYVQEVEEDGVNSKRQQGQFWTTGISARRRKYRPCERSHSRGHPKIRQSDFHVLIFTLALHSGAPASPDGRSKTVLLHIPHMPVWMHLRTSFQAHLAEDGISMASQITRPEPPVFVSLRIPQIYQVQPRSLYYLKENIRQILSTITTDMCRKVMTNMRLRLQRCEESSGRHFEHLL